MCAQFIPSRRGSRGPKNTTPSKIVYLEELSAFRLRIRRQLNAGKRRPSDTGTTGEEAKTPLTESSPSNAGGVTGQDVSKPGAVATAALEGLDGQFGNEVEADAVRQLDLPLETESTTDDLVQFRRLMMQRRSASLVSLLEAYIEHRTGHTTEFYSQAEAPSEEELEAQRERAGVELTQPMSFLGEVEAREAREAKYRPDPTGING